MSDLTTRLRALGIEPGEAACDYELRAQESNLIPRLSCDAALDELVSLCEDLYLKRLPCREAEVAQRRYEQAEAEIERLHHDGQTRVSRELHEAALAEQVEAREQAEADLMFRTEQRDDILKRLEQAEAERNALQHIIDCADTPLMRDVMAARDQAKAKLTRSETAFGILSDSHPGEAQEAWRKAGELGGEVKP